MFLSVVFGGPETQDTQEEVYGASSNTCTHHHLFTHKRVQKNPQVLKYHHEALDRVPVCPTTSLLSF